MSADSVNCWLAILTAALVIVGAWQVWLLWYAFHADHRPNLHIRQINLRSDLNDLESTRPPLEFEIVIVNRGASHATIRESNLAFIFDRTSGPLFRNLQTIGNILSGKLKSGVEVVPRFNLDYQRDGLSLLTFPPNGLPALSLYLVGVLRYRDRIHRHYTTAFCRRLVVAVRRAGIQDGRDVFRRVDDPDYEYAD